MILVTSGAIARGMRVMGLPQRPSAIGELQAASAVGQGKLYRVYDELLRERGVTSAQVLLTFFDMSARTHYLNARQTLATLLEWRVLPVINENDTTATDEISFGDNDFLAAQVAMLVGADLLVLLTDIDGLYSADPRIDAERELVEEVSDFAALEELEIGHTTSPLGSGGMRSKVVAADMATAAGIATVICNGLRAEALEAVLAGEPRGDPVPAARGALQLVQAVAEVREARARHAVIDAGAARAVREGSASLLPVGVVEVQRRLRRGRRGRDRRARRAGGGRAAAVGKGHLQLLRRGAAPGDGHEVGRCAGDPAARERRGGAPRLPCPGLTRHASAYPCRADGHSHDSSSVADICRCRASAPRESSRRSTPRARTRRSTAIAQALIARTEEILAGQRARHGGRPRG